MNNKKVNIDQNKEPRESFNEQRKIGNKPNTSLTSKPNTTKPNKKKD